MLADCITTESASGPKEKNENVRILAMEWLKISHRRLIFHQLLVDFSPRHRWLIAKSTHPTRPGCNWTISDDSRPLVRIFRKVSVGCYIVARSDSCETGFSVCRVRNFCLE